MAPSRFCPRCGTDTFHTTVHHYPCNVKTAEERFREQLHPEFLALPDVIVNDNPPPRRFWEH